MQIDPYGFEKVSFKLEEAEFFLNHVRGAGEDVLPFYVSAFLAAARSVRDSLKRLCDQLPEAIDWFRNEDKKLHDSEAHDRFRSLRNISLHEGENPVNAWSVELYVDNGSVETITRCHLCSREGHRNAEGNVGAYDDCREHFGVLLRLSLAARGQFGTKLDPHGITGEAFEGLRTRNGTDATRH